MDDDRFTVMDGTTCSHPLSAFCAKGSREVTMDREEGVELRWFLLVIRRWWWLIAVCCVLAGISAFLVSSRIAPVYRATTTLLVDQAQGTEGTQYSDIMASERLANTYSQMLTGRPVLEATIAQLELEGSPNTLAKRMEVSPIPDTQLVRMSVNDTDPVRAALTANTIADLFVAQVQALQTERYAQPLASTRDQMDALSVTIQEAQAEIDSLSTKKARKEAEMARLEDLRSGQRDDSQALQQKLEELRFTVAESTANISVIDAARVPEVSAQSPVTSTVTDTATVASVATVTFLVNPASAMGTPDDRTLASERLAQTYSQMLTGREVLEAALAELELGESADALAHRVRAEPVPDTQLLRLSVEDADPAWAALMANTIAGVFTARLQALQTRQYTEVLAGMQEQLDKLSALLVQTQTAIDAGNAAIAADAAQLARLERLLAEYHSDHNGLQQDYKALSLTVAQSTNNVNVVEAARAPTAPVSPNVLLNAAMAALAGLLAGAGAAFLLEYLDDTIRIPEDMGDMAGVSTMGTIGQLTNGDKLVMVTRPRSPTSEAYRVLATNIRFASLDHPLHTLLVTSPGPGEGKSTTTANLAVTMAETGLRVVAMDADLRKPHLHKIFGLHSHTGLTSSLLDGKTAEQLQHSGVDGLQVLASGALPANPTWITGSERMRHILEELAEVADLVVIDSPPALLLAETAVLARAVDAVLLVARSGETRRQDLKNAAKSLRQVGANPIGVVLNAVPAGRDGYYHYYHYYTPDSQKAGTRLGRWLQETGTRLAPFLRKS